jgi:raffinose/stachyose/melibiose transport system substrate-binding protein
MRSRRPLAALAVATAAALTATACGSSGSANSGSSSGKTTLTWWHNGNTQPLKGVWQQVASAYHTAHPNVSFTIDPYQNELFKTKIPLALKSGNPPDVFQQWGGGQEATQLQSGKLANLTSAVSGWIGQLGKAAQGWQVNGQQYGIPYDLHVVGFWYRKDLFSQAGIASPPTTIAQLESDDAKLKSHGIAPIAVGSKDGWPDAFWWEYFAVRECSEPAITQAMKSVSLSAPCFTKATSDLAAFMKTSPFQSGFQATPAQTGAGSSAGLLANGKAAMELQGDWETTVVPALTSDKSIDSKLGWFPFPAVSGGAGDPAAVLGGGDGFSCTTVAPEPACADFLKYIDSVPVQDKLVKQAAVGLPANSAADSVITDPALQDALRAHNSAPYIAEYFDIALPTNPGQALDTAVANYFAGTGSNSTIINSVNSNSGH